MNEEIEILSPPFSRKAETYALVNTFSSMTDEEFISYEKTKNIINTHPQSETGRGITASARRIVQREKGIVIECIRNEGFRRVADPGKIMIAKTHVTKMHRTIQRGTKVLRAVDRTKLNNEHATNFSLTAAVYHALDLATKPRILTYVEQTMNASSHINCGEVLRLVLSKNANGEK